MIRKLMIVGLLGAFNLSSAQNLLVNGNFDSGIVDWSTYTDANRHQSWQQNDGNIALGSLEFSTRFNNGGTSYSYSYQIPVTPSSFYKIKAYLKPLSSSHITSAKIWVEWRDVNGAFTGIRSTFYSVSPTASDPWVLVNERVQVPENMHFAIVSLGAQGNTDASNAENIARFDDVYFGLINDIFINGFE